MIVEICASNELASYVDALESEGFEVVTYSCLDRCESCIAEPYAYADGKLLETTDPEALFALLRAMKEEDVCLTSDDDW